MIQVAPTEPNIIIMVFSINTGLLTEQSIMVMYCLIFND